MCTHELEHSCGLSYQFSHEHRPAAVGQANGLALHRADRVHPDLLLRRRVGAQRVVALGRDEHERPLPLRRRLPLAQLEEGEVQAAQRRLAPQRILGRVVVAQLRGQRRGSEAQREGECLSRA